MADPFAQFGGKSLSNNKADPFAQFGGKALTPVEDKPVAQTTGEDPFAQFGGKALAPPKPEESTLTSIGKGITGGLEEALLPFTMDKEDFSSDKSWTELGTRMVTQYGAGMAATAAIGAAATVVGVAAAPAALIGAAAYGIYAGLGYEVSRSEAEGKEFSPLRAAGRVALEVNPLVRGGGKLVKALRVVGQGVGEGAVEYSHSENKTAAALAAGFGMFAVAASPLAKQASKTEQLNGPSEGVLGKIADFVSDESIGIGEDTRKLFSEMDTTLPTEIPKEFKKFMLKNSSVENLDKSFERVTKGLTPEKLQESYELFKWSEAQQIVTSKKVEEIAKGLYDNPSDSIVPLLSAIEDPKYIARRADDNLGLGMEDILDRMSENHHKYTNHISGFVGEARDLTAAAKKSNINPETIGKMIAGKQAKQGEAGELAQKWANLYEAVRVDLAGKGYRIDKRVDYLNMKSLEAPDMHNLMNLKLEKFKKIGAKAKKDPMQLTVEDFKEHGGSINPDLLVEELKDLKSVAANVLKKKSYKQINTVLKVRKAIKDSLNPANKVTAGFDVGARFQRHGEIPDDFRSFDVGQNFMNYLGGNYKAVYFGDTLAELDRAASTMNQLGLTKSAEYWKKYSQHISGVDTGFQSMFTHKKNEVLAKLRYTQRFDTEATSFTKWTAKQQENAMDFMAWSTTLVYPNFLGGNVRAALRNYTQTFALTAPSFKGTFGTKIVTEGWGKMIKNAGNLDNILREKNITSHGDIVRAGYKELSDYLNTSKLRDYSESAGRSLMYLYTKSDDINRSITYFAGEAWAKRLVKGDKAAIAALKDLSPAAKMRLRRIGLQDKIKAGDVEGIGDVLGRTLISDTQFNYGKEQMHQFGREMGQLFSMFTKWPAMIGSDMAYNVHKHGWMGGAVKNSWKYGTPLLLLHLAQVNRDKLEGKNGKLSAYLLGKDLTAMAPVMSVNNMDVFGGPVQRAFLDIPTAATKSLKKPFNRLVTGKGVRSKEVSKAFSDIWKASKNSLKGFSPIPGQPLINEADRISENFAGKSLNEWIESKVK